MTTRTRTEVISFLRPFSLPGAGEPFPAGSYTVETQDEAVETMSHLGYRRVSTMIFLPAEKGTLSRFVEVQPSDIEAALRRDASGRASISTESLPEQDHDRNPS